MAYESNTNSRFDRDYEREQNERHEAREIKSETDKSEGKASFCC